MFRCDRLRATLRPEACLQFQAMNAVVLKKGATLKNPRINGLPRIVPHRSCLDCPQGENVKNGQQETFEVDADMKTCSSCKVTKPKQDNFYESPAGSGKYGSECKACAAARHKRTAALKKIQAGLAAPAITANPEDKINMANSEPAVQTLADTDPAANAGRESETPPAEMPPGKIKRLESGGVCKICNIVQPLENFKRQIYSDKPNNICNTCWNAREIPSRTCRNCGHQGPEEDFHCIGNVPTEICRTCAKAKRQTSLARNNPKQNPNLIVVDFTDFPEVRRNLEADAKGNLRSVPNEILYRLLNP